MNEITFLLPTEISIRSAHWSFDQDGEIIRFKFQPKLIIQ